MLINRFLFDDDNGQGGQGAPPSAPQIDYDKLASIIEGKQKATEDTVIKSYMKQQGLSEDEMKEAISKFKTEKAARTPDINALNQQIAEANQRATVAEVQLKAMSMVGELGVTPDKMPYILKLADVSEVVKDGKISDEKLKESLSEVLKALPELKTKAEETNQGFKIGADGGDKQKTTTQDELAKIFGVKIK